MTYKIRITSQLLFIATWIITGLGGAFLTVLFLPKGHSILAIIIIILLIALVVYLPKIFATGDAELYLNDEILKVSWVRPFIFVKWKDFEIPFKRISAYKYHPDQYFEYLNITLDTGEKIKLYHHHFYGKDEFKVFVKDFLKSVGTYNEINSEGAGRINREKTIYETKGGVALAIFAVISIIGIPILLFKFPDRDSGAPFGLIASGGGAVYYLVMFYLYRTNTEEIKDEV